MLNKTFEHKVRYKVTHWGKSEQKAENENFPSAACLILTPRIDSWNFDARLENNCQIAGCWSDRQSAVSLERLSWIAADGSQWSNTTSSDFFLLLCQTAACLKNCFLSPPCSYFYKTEAGIYNAARSGHFHEVRRLVHIINIYQDSYALLNRYDTGWSSLWRSTQMSA